MGILLRDARSLGAENTSICLAEGEINRCRGRATGRLLTNGSHPWTFVRPCFGSEHVVEDGGNDLLDRRVGVHFE